MAAWKNRIAADPTLEEERDDKKSKRPNKVERSRSVPAQYTRCWACFLRLKVSEKDDPDEVIATHRKSTCPKGYTSS